MMRLLIVLAMFCSGLLAFCQPRLEFEKVVHDFGQVQEAGGKIEYSFIFRNIGNEPLVLNSVKASCGCTSSFWTNEPIEPGGSGKVTALYDPFNRPGPFNKSLTVISNAHGGTVNLQIKGHVEPRVRTIEDHLPVKNGALRMKHRAFNFGRITTERVLTKDFEVYNDSDSILAIKIGGVPNHLIITAQPVELPSKTKGLIRISYNPEKKNALGYQTDKFTMTTNQGTDQVFEINATIEQYFPSMTEEELADAPKIKLAKASFDFGSVMPGTKLETEVTIMNEGKSDLMVKGVQSNCDCVLATIADEIVKPGASSKLKLTFDTSNRKGKQYKSVTIFSNDPTNPVQMVMLKAEM